MEQDALKLSGDGQTDGRPKVQGRGSYRHTAGRTGKPTADGPLADRLVAVTGGHGPLQGGLDSICDGMTDC